MMFMDENQGSSLAEQVASALGVTGNPSETTSATQTSETTDSTPGKQEQTTETTSQQTQQIAQETGTDGKQTNPMRDLRQQYSSTKKEADDLKSLLQRIADQKGMTIDQLRDQIQIDEDRKKAEKLGVTPEVQKTLREQQDKIEALERRYREENFNNRLAAFRQNYNLSDDQLKDFAMQARNAGIDILNPGVDMTVVYRSLNYNNLMNNERESIRQQILQEMNSQKQQSPSVNQTSTNTNTAPKEVTGQDILNQLFATFSK